MYGSDRVPDKRIIQKVTQRLSRTGTGQCKVSVTVHNGDVTLSGEIQYDNQRRALLIAARGVEGVRAVVVQLKIKPKAKPKERKWN